MLIQRYRVLNKQSEVLPPGNSLLGTLNALFHLVFTTTLQRLYYWPHYTDEKDEDKEIN